MSRKPLYHLIFAVSCLLQGCSSTNSQTGPEERAAEADSTVVVDTRVPVSVLPVQVGDFSIQMLTNGTITADQQVEIRLRSTGRIEALPVIEGQFVHQGDLLCRQEDEALQLQLQQNRVALEEARVKLDEMLILQGGEAGDTASVPEGIRKTLLITSGWNGARQNILQTEFQIGRPGSMLPLPV